MPQSAFFKQRNRCLTDQNQTSHWTMKKLILIIALTTFLAGLSALGQGYFQFVTGKSQVWDGFSGGVATLSTRVNTAFLWAANGATPSVAAFASSVPSSTTVATSFFMASAAWTAILTDPNFTLAINSANGQIAVQQTTANGAINYNGGAAFGVQGTSVGTTYSVFFIGWNYAYATPQLAAAAASTDGYVGWSSPFSYTATAFTATANSMSGVTPAFGVTGPIPEPSTLALTGLAGLSLMLLRRRK
jgi:hypothetical protein